ncbi:MAG: rRNA pseudouridine synthase [Acidobacteria bacterium]|nr:rRNA pseudouridine synthase [Acidobacteriota bacterium]
MLQRLQKIIAAAGVTSRRKAEELILQGRVTVNGRVVRELGAQADAQHDHIKVDGKLLRPEPLEYYALNKPRGVLSSVSDPENRAVVTAFIKTSARLYPVGRLDYHSEGLILLTNDGQLARRVTQPGQVRKVYEIKVKGCADSKKLEKLTRGMIIDGERLQALDAKILKVGENCWYKVVLVQGKNQQLRRMFDQLGHAVLRLRRVAIGPVELGKLPVGAYRKLTSTEIRELRGDRKK